MFTKLYAEIKKVVSENWKMICVFVIFASISVLPLPYYIDTPGGAIDISKKIEVEEKNKTEGSLNFAYVTELRATPITYFLSFFQKEWEVLKKSEITYDNETIEEMQFRDKLLLEESNDYAILLAYEKLGKPVTIKKQHLFITYLDESAETDLKVGDEVIAINDKKIKNKDHFLIEIQKYNIGDTVSLSVKNNGKQYKRVATLIGKDEKPMIGVMVSSDLDLETNPSISIKKEENESGPSGGLMLTLAIYNSLTKEDITNGLKIVGTGTIDRKGNVGTIGGVEFKLKGAVKEKADLFLVPSGKNYEDAMKLKEEKGYKIDIQAVSTFDEALQILVNKK